MADKTFDPRFDPAFQRGYAAEERGERADAVQAAGAVDSYRAETAGASTQQRPLGSSGAAGRRAEASAPPPFVPPASTLAPALGASTESGAPDPQSQYVDDTGATAGAVAGDVATAAPASLARNPWLYVLWALGAMSIVATTATLWWANSILYGNSNGALESYAMVASVQSLAPGGFILGSVSLVGALLLHGLSWMPKNQ